MQATTKLESKRRVACGFSCGFQLWIHEHMTDLNTVETNDVQYDILLNLNVHFDPIHMYYTSITSPHCD